MRTGTLVCTVGCLAAALAGCTKEEGPGIPIASAPQEIAKAVCPKAYACCTPKQLMGNDLAGTDEPSCEAKTTEGFGRHLDAVLASQNKGRVHYRGERLAECLAFIRTRRCDELNTTTHFSGVPGCGSFVEARVPPGAPCSFDWECVEGVCEKADPKADGACRARAKQDEACATVPCAEGYRCDGATRTCVTFTPEGQACTNGLACASGNCTASGGMPGTCGAPTADKCFYQSACRYGRGRVSLVSLLAVAGMALVAARRRRSRAVRR